MVGHSAVVDTSTLPRAPRNPLPRSEQVKALRAYHTGLSTLRDAGGYVTLLSLGPSWLVPPMVVATSPQGIHDILGRRDGLAEKANSVFVEMRRLMGGNLFDLTHRSWLPRRRTLQPLFTKHYVSQFAGHMAQAADVVASRWCDDRVVDLDGESRTLTMRALGRSVLGVDLDERADALSEPMRVALTYIADRALQPVHAPNWMPTPARRRARQATAAMKQLARDIVDACRTNPDMDAPLVHALIAAVDPETGKSLPDNEIYDEMLVFLIAGHDTTSTTLAYALWELGRHPSLQDRVYKEVAELGDRQLAPDDLPRLSYTVQVLHEALRLCPPGPAASRMALQDIVVDGHRVEAGTVLIAGIRAVHTDPDLWDRPLVFDPDRFTAENSRGRDRWQYLPFGAGPRSCIGDHFAMLEATLALATCVRHAEIRSLEPTFPLAVPFTMVADGPIRARVSQRA